MAAIIESGPADLHIKINPNTNWSRVFTINDSDDNPVDISSDNIVWEWTKIGSPHTVSETFATSATGIVFVTDGTDGKFRVTVNVDSIWDENTNKETLYYEHTMYRLNGSDEKDPMLEGTIKVGINVF